MSIRVLSNALQEKAEDELNEVTSRIPEDLDYIREWLTKQPHLKARTDDQWLMSFLRGCKFSLQRTKERLDYFYTMKTLVPEFYTNRDPFSPEIQEILKRSIIIILPKTKGPSEPRVAIFRPGQADPEKITMADMFKVTFMIIDILHMEDDNCTVAGKDAFMDLHNMSFKYMIQLTPNIINKSLMCIQNACPSRFKGMKFVNSPTFFETIYSIIQTFLTEKMKSRVNVYKDLGSMHKELPLSILPKEYGGEEISCDEIAAQWKLKVESYRDWFIEDDQYCTDETKRPGKPRTSAEMFGVEGSFRKLQID